MGTIRDIPEVQALDRRHHLIRIPDQLDVPLTERVRRVIDTPQFRRLAQISQLGLVALVYPAAHHTRFEHCLGVYRMALLYLKQLAHDERFVAAVSDADAERLLLAALLHDIGHWPFCHPIEDICLENMPRHEQLAQALLEEEPLSQVLRGAWRIEPAEVARLLADPPQRPADHILQSLLSGPIDIDKMDYLVRDSLHAGVPYGRNFDQQRLLGSLCLNQAADGLAIRDKGRTAAEMMVFARYVMFSEVYWHHAVRAATAMLQRAFYLLYHQLDLDGLLRLTERPLIAELQRAGDGGPAGQLLDGLFGPTRRLYKRLAQYSFFQNGALYQRLARRPYPWLVRCSEHLAVLLSRRLQQPVASHEVLFDAPPVQREVEFEVEIFFPKEDCYRWLGDVSPVVKTLAQKQFDDYVKRVRIFVHPRLAPAAQQVVTLPQLVEEAIRLTDESSSA